MSQARQNTSVRSHFPLVGGGLAAQVPWDPFPPTKSTDFINALNFQVATAGEKLSPGQWTLTTTAITLVTGYGMVRTEFAGRDGAGKRGGGERWGEDHKHTQRSLLFKV